MIGVLGGTFDPIHHGHLRAALDVHQALAFRELRFIPLNLAVHRPQPQASAAQRRAMLEAAIDGVSGLRVDDRELGRAGGSYTVDTLISLRRELGYALPICLLVGGDAFNGFFDWYRPYDILDLAHLVVMRRPGAPPQPDLARRAEVERRLVTRREQLEQLAAGRIWFETVTQLDISSTRIRRMLAAGQSPRYLLPDAVIELIDRESYYRVRDNLLPHPSISGTGGESADPPMATEFATANPEGK
jgi:nicotinate-nucleotide adenylyltransferase